MSAPGRLALAEVSAEQGGGHPDVWREAERLLEGLPAGGDAPPDDRYRVDRDAGEGASAYGEIPAPSAARLLAWLRLTSNDHFVDLGSGSGRLVLQAALSSRVGSARGVELSGFRHALAECALARLRARGTPALVARLESVRFEAGDLRCAELASATVIYAGATVFPDPLKLALAAHVHAQAPSLRTLLVGGGLPARVATPFEECARVRVPMSWSASEWVYLYTPRTGS